MTMIEKFITYMTEPSMILRWQEMVSIFAGVLIGDLIFYNLILPKLAAHWAKFKK